MSQQMKNFLWLMIICCSVCQITCSEKLKISINVTNQCFSNPAFPVIALTCQSHGNINNFYIINVTLNISSQGQCKTQSFRLTVQEQKKEIRLTEMGKDINQLFLLKNNNCQRLESSNPKALTCQNQRGNGNGGSCLEIPSVDPGKQCRGATYDDNICKESKRSSYVLRFIKSEWMCVNCSTSALTVTLQPHEVIYNISVQDGDGDIDPSGASDYMNKMESEMEKIEKSKTRKEGIVMGDVIGLLHVQAKNTETKDICYSSDEDIMNDVDCESYLKAGFSWSVKISSEAFNKSRQENNGSAFLGILQFYDMRNKVPPSQADEIVSEEDLQSLTYITSIGCGISMFFMAIALFMHFLLRKAKSNQATKILMNMFVALCLLNISFLSNESVANTGDNAACVFIALLLHYSMLASFTWFFIQALHMYLWLIRQNVSITNYMRKITVLGWAFPSPIVLTIASVGEYKTLILKSSRMCWITNNYIHYIVNIGYYALVFIFTTGIFIMIVTKIIQSRIIRSTEDKRKTFRKQLMMVLSLFLLFGLTWSVAFFSYGPMILPSYYIFTVLNSSQGFFLFLYYYHIHNDIAGGFSDDPRSSGSTTTMVQPNMNGLENVYN